MSAAIPQSPSLAVLLRRQSRTIARAWAGNLRQIPSSRYESLSDAELEASARRAVAAVADWLATGSDEALDIYLADLCQARLEHGFAINEVVEGLLLLKETMIGIARRRLPPAGQGGDPVLPIDACTRHMVGRFSHLCAEAMQGRLRAQQTRTALMLHAVQTASGSLDLVAVLERLAASMVTSLGVRACAIYLLDADSGRLWPRALCGSPDDGGAADLAARTLSLAESPLLARALAGRAPVLCADPAHDGGLSAEVAAALGRSPLLAVPIAAGTRVLGIALVLPRPGGEPLDQAAINMAWGVATAAALAVDNARLYEETRQRLAESESFGRVSAALAQQAPLADLLDLVCRETCQLTHAAGSAIYLDDGGGDMRVVTFTGPPPDADCLAARGSLVALLVGRGRPLLRRCPEGGREGCGGVITVPLRVKGAVIGALQATQKAGGFSPDDLRILGRFADKATLAIEHARLLQQEEALAVLRERQRLARELHDSVAQSLYSISLYAGAAASLLGEGRAEAAAEHLGELKGMTRQALGEMRQLIFELRPAIVEQEGLAAAVQARLQSVERRSGLQVEWQVEGVEQLEAEQARELYGIAQESLNNVLKHSRARKLRACLRFQGAGVQMEIADDGVGFDPRTAGRGLGLRGMRERAAAIGADLHLSSRPGKGTSVRVTLASARATAD